MKTMSIILYVLYVYNYTETETHIYRLYVYKISIKYVTSSYLRYTVNGNRVNYFMNELLS